MRSLWLNICVLIVIQQATFSFAYTSFQRGGHGPHGHHGPPGDMFKMCCKVEPTPDDIKHHEAMKKLFEECHQELGEPEPGPGKHKDRFVCMAECVVKKQNLLNEDGKINEDTAKVYVEKEIATQDHLKSIAAETTTKCIEVAKESSGESTCSKIPIIFMHCVMKKIFNACPADLQDQDEHCVKFREKLAGSEQPENSE